MVDHSIDFLMQETIIPLSKENHFFPDHSIIVLPARTKNKILSEENQETALLGGIGDLSTLMACF
jgi:hypothetical protein